MFGSRAKSVFGRETWTRRRGQGIELDEAEVDEPPEGGFQVRVQVEERRRTVSVRYVESDDQGYRVGLNWDD